MLIHNSHNKDLEIVDNKLNFVQRGKAGYEKTNIFIYHVSRLKLICNNYISDNSN